MEDLPATKVQICRILCKVFSTFVLMTSVNKFGKYTIFTIAGFVLAIAIVFAFRFADYAFGNCLKSKVEIKIYPGDGCDSLVVRLGDAVDSAKFLSYCDTYFDGDLKPGFYRFDGKISQRYLLRTVQMGYQTPVRITFNNVSTLQSLAGKVSKYFMADSSAFIACLSNPTVHSKYGLSAEMFPSLFIPDTYEMYWTQTPEQFVERMAKEYDRFWNDERKQKASKLGLSPQQIVIIASIVDKETNFAPDKTKIAGVYINRLRKGMPLQADPTVKFAVGDMGLKRVLNKHLAVDSPYNTYKYPGLTPGPISFPDGKTIDAVLNYTGHKYLYFCAAADMSGRSEFAETLAQHNRNAKAYQAKLNKMKIK